jgi:hypothetical protein
MYPSLVTAASPVSSEVVAAEYEAKGPQYSCPMPTVPGDLHGHEKPTPSPVELILEVFGSHGTAGSIDPPRGRRSSPSVPRIARKRL